MAAAPYNYDYILKYIIIGDQVKKPENMDFFLDFWWGKLTGFMTESCLFFRGYNI